MQITHEEAHRLIQFKVDHGLNSSSEEYLSKHLTACAECRIYSETIKDTESTLRATLSKQWNAPPLPLQMDIIYAKLSPNGNSNILLTTRTALIGIAFVMFAFITWQSINNGNRTTQSPLSTVPLIPTPSTQHVATNTQQNDCKELRYLVQDGDTLDGIARQFSISKESILLANHLMEDTIAPGWELVLSICKSTPTVTTHPPTFTITPIFEVISTTPG